MTHPYDLNRGSLLLLAPALALTLAACGDDGTTTVSASTTGESTTDEETTNTPTTNTPTSNPPTTGDTTTDGTTDTPTTNPVTTTDPTTTTDATTSGTTTDATTSGTTTDGTTSGTTTDGTTSGTTTDGTTTDTTTDGTTGGVTEFTGVWATANPALLVTDALVSMTPALDAKNATLTVAGDVVSIQSVGVTSGGDSYATYDAPGMAGGIAVFKDLTDGAPVNGPYGLGTRVIRGPATGLVAPKGIELLGPVGLFIVADTGAADIKVYKLSDSGDVAPQFTIADLGSSAAVWDIHYAANQDALYAAGTNGEVQVYEDFKDAMGATGPDRTIVPTVLNTKVSINLHGITIDSGVLYLSDVGDALNPTDGQIFVLEGASALNGNEDVDQRIQGGMLGNPVDIELRPGAAHNLYVAEKSNDAVLVYTENLMTNDLEFNKSFAVIKPESVAIVPSSRIMVASNPAGVDTDAAQLLAAPLVGALALNATFDRLGSVSSIESLVLATNGDGYVSFDGPLPMGAGVFVVPALTGVNMDGVASTLGGRIWGPKTGLLTPKGLALNAAQDRLFVADTAGLDIKVFAADVLTDVAPVFELNDLGGGAVWDMHYDDATDMLYAAGVDGTVRVFENVLANPGAAPVRIITPTNDMDVKISINLHGIHYDVATNSLLLSDVGSAMSNSDGQIFVIAAADAAEGNVVVQAQIGGDQTKLGNPVDIAFDGVNLYVAEKANSTVLRYDAVLSLAGTNNLAETAMIDVANAESVQLAYTVP